MFALGLRALYNDTMWYTIQRLRVLLDVADLDFQSLKFGYINSVTMDIQTYSPKNYKPLQARNKGHEDRWWKVAYDTNKHHRELCVRHAPVASFNNVSLNFRG
jgi:hypothetical protein